MFLRSRISLGRFRDDGWGYPTTMQRRPPHRHPGLVPGPWLAPGSNKKGHNAKTTLIPSSRTRSGTYLKRPRYQNNPCWMFLRSRISLGRFRDDGCVLLIPDKRCAFPGRRMEVFHRDGEMTASPSSRTCSGTYLKRPGYQNNPLPRHPGLVPGSI